MSDYKAVDRLQVKLSSGRIVEATIKAIIDTTDGVRLQVSFGDETALIYPWQIVIEARCSSGDFARIREVRRWHGVVAFVLITLAMIVLVKFAMTPEGCSPRTKDVR
jgi:hypothetical protein